MKKIIALILMLTLSVLLCSCGSAKKDTDKTSKPSDKDKTSVSTPTDDKNSDDKQSENENPSEDDKTSDDETPAPAPVKKDIKVVYFGDSVTYRGQASMAYATYVTSEINKNRTDVNLININKGVPGNTVADLLARVETDVIAENPDIISILVGVNDTATWKQNATDQQFKADYEKILDTIKQKLPNAKVVLMTPFVIYKNDSYSSKTLEKRVACVKELAQARGLTLVDTAALMTAKEAAGESKTYGADGVHPNESGAKLIADEWIKVAGGIIK